MNYNKNVFSIAINCLLSIFFSPTKMVELKFKK